MKLKLLSLYSFGRENIEHSYHLAKYIELTTSVKRKRSDSLDVASRPSKQQKIIAVVAVTLCQVSQANDGRLIICFFNEGLLPLSTVGRWSAVKPYCADMVSVMKANIRDTLRPLSFVATTTGNDAELDNESETIDVGHGSNMQSDFDTRKEDLLTSLDSS